MKKSSFVAMVLETIGGVAFALGMCMCLLPQWNAFAPGVVLGVIGALIGLAAVIIWRRMEGKAPIRPSGRTIGAVALGVAGALVLGVGMCMVMVWSMMLPGILVGLVGIVLLMLLVPLCIGIK